MDQRLKELCLRLLAVLPLFSAHGDFPGRGHAPEAEIKLAARVLQEARGDGFVRVVGDHHQVLLQVHQA